MDNSKIPIKKINKKQTEYTRNLQQFPSDLSVTVDWLVPESFDQHSAPKNVTLKNNPTSNEESSKLWKP